jgi:hypothetical protein
VATQGSIILIELVDDHMKSLRIFLFEVDFLKEREAANKYKPQNG